MLHFPVSLQHCMGSELIRLLWVFSFLSCIYSCLLFVQFGALRFALPRRQRIPLYWMSLAAVQVAATAKPAQLFASCDANVRSAPALLNVAGSFRGGQQQSAATLARRMRPPGNPKLSTSACEGVWVYVCVCVCVCVCRDSLNKHSCIHEKAEVGLVFLAASRWLLRSHPHTQRHTRYYILCVARPHPRQLCTGTRCTIFILG